MKSLAIRLLILSSSLLLVRAALEIKEEKEEIAERGLVSRYILTSAIGQFALNPPNGWDAQPKTDEGTLLFVSERLNAAFSIQFVTNSTVKTEKDLCAYVAKRWPFAPLIEPFPCIARDTQGVGKEIVYRAADGATVYRTRIGLIPYGSGAVEFVLTAPEEDFPRSASTWVAVLNSFSKTR